MEKTNMPGVLTTIVGEYPQTNYYLYAEYTNIAADLENLVKCFSLSSS